MRMAPGPVPSPLIATSLGIGDATRWNWARQARIGRGERVGMTTIG